MRCLNADKLIMKDLGNGNYLVTAEAMANARTFEAEPVRHGHWIEHEWADIEEEHLISNYECTLCHTWVKNKTNYCPDCGAKMEGEKYDL